MKPLSAMKSSGTVKFHSTMEAPPTPSPAGLLLRAVDDSSKGNIKSPEGGLTSQAFDYLLYTSKQRADALRNHANYRSRKATPFVSTTTSPDEIAKNHLPHLFQRAAVGEPFNGRIMIINAHARLAAGMPVISLKNELEHYKVHTPYCTVEDLVPKNPFFDNEHLLLFRANQEEIVGVWRWKELVEWSNKHGYTVLESDPDGGVERIFKKWFKAVAVPAFHQHEKSRQEKLLLTKEKEVAGVNAEIVSGTE